MTSLREQNQMDENVFSILEKTPLFVGLEREDLESIVSMAQRRPFSSGEHIIRENEPGNCVYLILSGKVQIAKSLESIGRKVIHCCDPGDFFGEMSILEDKPRSAEVTAIEATELLVLTREHFEDILLQFPPVARNILRVISSRLRETDNMLIESLEAHARKLKDENTRLYEELSKTYPKNISSRNPAMQALVEMAKKSATTPITVLLLGESGTGKEVLSRCIHQWSDRRRAPFIAINCAALPSNLLESELFGHERGAFTGATQMKKGKFEIADGGTVFLDEIGDMAVETQAKVLRFLQDQEFEHVGGTKTIQVNVRVIAATNRDISQSIKEGTFREDLYYRLNVVSLILPPLRDRKEDIPDLCNYFLNRFSRELKKSIKSLAEDVLKAFNTYSWPGNIRELANIIERGIALSDTNILTLADLPNSIIQQSPTISSLDSAKTYTYQEAIDRAKKEAIDIALNSTQGNQTRAAEILGLERTYLSRLMKQYGRR